MLPIIRFNFHDNWCVLLIYGYVTTDDFRKKNFKLSFMECWYITISTDRMERAITFSAIILELTIVYQESEVFYEVFPFNSPLPKI